MDQYVKINGHPFKTNAKTMEMIHDSLSKDGWNFTDNPPSYTKSANKYGIELWNKTIHTDMVKLDNNILFPAQYVHDFVEYAVGVWWVDSEFIPKGIKANVAVDYLNPFDVWESLFTVTFSTNEEDSEKFIVYEIKMNVHGVCTGYDGMEHMKGVSNDA